MAKKPTRVTIRSYQVGFGDCFLLGFHYGADRKKTKDSRYILIDFGSTAMPKGATHSMTDIANDIKATVGTRLQAVIATHRHRDHISGFGGPSGKIIRDLKPRLVLQPWTEDPKAAKDAKKAVKRTQGLKGAAGFVASLESMHGIALQTLKEVARGVKPSLARQLSFLGEENLKNADAVRNLMSMSRKRVYAAFGDPSGLDALLPGVKVDVLGPPTLAQSDSIRKERARDDAEFWHFAGLAMTRANSGTDGGGAPLFGSKHRAPAEALPPFATRWFLPRLQDIRGEQLLELVRILDSVMNNTSLILLFEVGKKLLLFPGDAQIENWSFALEKAKKSARLRERLEQVDVYKVGHHGSLNATPKSLWNMFKKKGGKRKEDRLHTFVSTMEGKHGSRDRETEVPREPLVDELSAHSHFLSTQFLTKRDVAALVPAHTATSKLFAETEITLG